jgi:hypothetical protein
MTINEPELSVVLRLTPKRAREFEDRLATEEEFRQRLEQSPNEVLAEYGIEIAPELIPEQVTLPTKEELSDLHESARGHRDLRIEEDEGRIMMWPFFFYIFAIAAHDE